MLNERQIGFDANHSKPSGYYK